MARKVATHTRVDWPVGPYYDKWVKGQGIHAWVRYKVKSADWYLDTLVAVDTRVPQLDRYVGVEMAVDGILTALCGAFDAAVGGLIQAIELAAGVPEGSRKPPHEYSWKVLQDLAKANSLTLSVKPTVTAALAGGRSTSPSGWLSQLQRLRNRAVHFNSLTRHWNVGGANEGHFIDVPGLGFQRPLPYLKRAREQVKALSEAILKEMDGLAAGSLVGAAPTGVTVTPTPVASTAFVSTPVVTVQ